MANEEIGQRLSYADSLGILEQDEGDVASGHALRDQDAHGEGAGLASGSLKLRALESTEDVDADAGEEGIDHVDKGSQHGGPQGVRVWLTTSPPGA